VAFAPVAESAERACVIGKVILLWLVRGNRAASLAMPVAERPVSYELRCTHLIKISSYEIRLGRVVAHGSRRLPRLFFDA